MNAVTPGRTWRFSCFALAALVGVVVPIGEGCASCAGIEPAYRFLYGQKDWWAPDSARLDVTDAAMVISYTAAEDGSKWEIEYRRVRAEHPD